MKREHWIITILGITACVLLVLLMQGCTLYISIEGKKKVEQPSVKYEPVAIKDNSNNGNMRLTMECREYENQTPKESKKSNCQKIKEKEQEDWLNLPLPQDHKDEIKNQ